MHIKTQSCENTVGENKQSCTEYRNGCTQPVLCRTTWEYSVRNHTAALNLENV